MFCDQPITCPDFPVMLGRYLGPAIDVGSAMSYKILKENDDYVCRTTVCSLNTNDLISSEHKQLRYEFDDILVEALGPVVTIFYFDYK